MYYASKSTGLRGRKIVQAVPKKEKKFSTSLKFFLIFAMTRSEISPSPPTPVTERTGLSGHGTRTF